MNEAGSRVEAKSNSNTNWIEGTVRFISSTQSYFEIHGILTTNTYPSSNTVWVRAFDVANNVSTSIVHTASSSTIKREYEYDADGNLVEFPAAVQFYMTNVQYSWDTANRMTSIVCRTKPQVTNFFLVTTNRTCLMYDGMGRLRQISEYGTNATPTGVVRFVWHGWTLAGELDGSNRLVRTYTYGVDISGTVGGAAGIGGLAGIHSYAAPVTNYYTRHDGKGNVTEVRRYNGTTAASYAYYEFGGVRYQTNTYNQPLRFQSKIFHTSAGISCFGYRWYDSVSGRWLSKDGLGEAGGINLYEYCLGSPLSYSDPDGKNPLLILGLFGLNVGLWSQISVDVQGLFFLDRGAISAEMRSNASTMQMLQQVVASGGEMDWPTGYGRAGQFGTDLPPQGDVCEKRQEVRNLFESTRNIRGYPSAANELMTRLGTGAWQPLPQDMLPGRRLELARSLLERQQAYDRFLHRSK